MDWNWFFSALAQSTAAIVGLIGAFVFTKIVNNQAAFSRFQEELADLRLRSGYLRDRAKHRYFEWYNDRIRDRIEERVDQSLRRENPPADIDEILSAVPRSPFDDPTEVEKFVTKAVDRIQEALAEEERERLQAERSRGGILGGLPSGVFETPIIPEIRGFRDYQVDDQIQEERELIDTLVVDIGYHISQIQNALSKARSDPYSSSMVSNTTILLGVLFLIGVVYPLSFLPVQEGVTVTFNSISVDAFIPLLMSLKGAILALVTVGVLGLAAAFLRINSSLSLENKDLSDLQEMCKLVWYSSYLAGLTEEEISTRRSLE